MELNTSAQQATHEVESVFADPRLRRCTARCSRLLALLQRRMEQPQRSWGQDLTVLDDPEAAGQPLVVRQALALQKTLVSMPIAIEPDDLVVGNAVDQGQIVRVVRAGFASAEERALARQEGSTIGAGLSHKTPAYRELLEKGLLGIIDEAEMIVAEASAGLPSNDRNDTGAEFRAVVIECRAVITLANRFADLARRLAVECRDPERRAELSRIEAVCRAVPAHPAHTLHQAIQSFWFVNFALFCTGTGLSCGRLDQYLFPYLQTDLESGRLSVFQAQELIDCLWLRFNDRAQIRRESFFVSEDSRRDGDGNRGGVVTDREPWEFRAGHRRRLGYSTDAADAINHFGQNILLSGIRPDGQDGTNVLTCLCLNAVEKFPFTSPVVTARLHRSSPPELVTRVAEVLRGGGGMPFVNNDDVLIPAYVDLGVDPRDARDYANSNCWETMIEGKSDQELIRGMNFLLCLELALNQGRSKMLGALGVDTGNPLEFESFDDLMDAWKTQLDHQLQQGIDLVGAGVASGTLEHSAHGKYRFNPLLTALTCDCIARRRDVIRGGARYCIWHVMGEAVADAIDAMAAVKRLVFDERSVDMATLLEALRANWVGHAQLRQRILHRMPKFANNDPYADDIGRTMMRFFVGRTRHHAARHPHVIFPASVGTFSWYAMIGREVAASADGRHDGDSIAANFSPATGADVSGPTAAISSYVGMEVDQLAAGAPLDLRLSAGSLQGAGGVARLAGLLEAFVTMGGNMLTVSVTVVEELRRAMEEPEKYRHLRVRMGGWSAYFVALSREQQLLHISRVEHGLA